MNPRLVGAAWALGVLLCVQSGIAYCDARDEVIRQANSLSEQARQLYDESRYRDALPIAERALRISEEALGRDNADVAEILYQLGRISLALASYRDATKYFQDALDIREKVFGAEHRLTADCLHGLGLVYWATGAYPQAESMYRRALIIREKILPPGDVDMSKSLEALAMIHAALGNYSLAESEYLRALQIREAAMDAENRELASLITNLANLYSSTNAYSLAEPLYRRALAIREKTLGLEHPDTAAALGSLGFVYMETGAYAKAEPIFQRVLMIYEKALGAQHPRMAVWYNNLASLYARLGDNAKSEEFNLRALEVREKVLGPDHPDTAMSVHNLAAVYSDTGAYEKAEVFYKRAIAIKEKALGSRHPRLIISLNGIAEMYWRIGNIDKALESYERARAIEAKIVDDFVYSESENRQLAFLQSMNDDVFEFVSFSIFESSQRSIALGLTSVLNYKGRVLDATSNNVARLRRSVDAKGQLEFDQLTEIARQLSSMTYQGIGKQSPDEYQRRLRELSRRREALEAKLAASSGEFRGQIAATTINAVRRALPPGAILVEYLRFIPFDPRDAGLEQRRAPPHYAAYVLKRKGEIAAVDLGAAADIDAVVEDFREALADVNRNDIRIKASVLAKKLLAPLGLGSGAGNRLIISPDGALNLIPFAALVDEYDRYFGEHSEITYVTSGRDLLRYPADVEAKGSVVIASPDYGKPVQSLARQGSSETARSVDLDRSGLVFRPLTNSLVEALALKNLLRLDDSSVLLGPNATEAKLKTVHNPRILHIASHGFFLDDRQMLTLSEQTVELQYENPLLRSGIALAGANERQSGPDEDGILTALEAAQLDLRGTELVVLSACDSGVGQVKNGEGVYGLRRALVLAGAQTQLMSLWKVSDAATSELMVDFYARLLKGESRSASLHHAQQDLLSNPARSHPYYWAAFVAIGNGAPLRGARSKNAVH